MNGFDRFMEFLVAGAFVYAGLSNIYSYRRRPRALGARHRRLPLGLPYEAFVAVGLFEIVAALALITPFSPIPPATLALGSATALALLSVASGIFRISRRLSAAPAAALFLLALFVIVGYTV